MNAQSEKFLKQLLCAISPSGYEGPAANLWADEARKFASRVHRDSHGNTHAVIKGTSKAKKKPVVMLAGHIDEIGFLITHIDDKGYLYIRPVGGWDPQIVQGQRVRILTKKGRVLGVIGKIPIHLQKPEARSKVVGIDEVWVDIAAKNRKEAEKRVAIGDPLVLDYEYERIHGDLAVARGFDNRIGAYIVLEAARLAKRLKSAAEVHSVATVQEEIGLRGATTAAGGIQPDIGIAVDVTFATDHPGMAHAMQGEGRVDVGAGPVLTRGPNINHKLFDLMVRTAKKQKIPLQITAEPRGTGTDANALQLSGGGVATALVGVPNRYMHSPCEMVSLSDVDQCVELIGHSIAAITPSTSFIPF